MITRTTFRKHTVTAREKYHCSCGNKFQRQQSSYFTMNPFNTKTSTECYQEIMGVLREKLKSAKCPKCNNSCEAIPKVKRK